MGTFIENINTLANAVDLAAGDAVADTVLARDQALAAALAAEAAALEAATKEDLSQDWADKGYGIPVTGTIGVDAKYSAYHWATVAQQMLGDPLINDSIISTLYTWSSSKINTSFAAKAAIDHLHTGVYEPTFNKNTAFNRNFSTAGGDYGSSTDVARKDHTHSTLYEPKRTTLGTAYNKNFGTVAGTVAEGSHVHTGVYMPYAAQGTAYNKNFVANIDAPLSTEIPRGNHVHKASAISYNSTGNVVTTSTTVQGAIGQLDATLGTFSIAEKSKISVGMTDSTYVVSIGAAGSGVLVNAGMTTLSYSKNAIYSNGIQVNYEVNPTKFIEGSYDATVSIAMEANTQYGISIAKNGVAIGSTFKALGGSTSSPAGTYAVSISGFVSNLRNGDVLGLLVYNMTNTHSVTLRSMTVSWAGQPEGAIISAGATVNHADVTNRDAINQHPTTSIYEPGSNRALSLLLDDKADKVEIPVLDNILSMTGDGNLKDSGISTTTINNKMGKIVMPTSDNIVAMTSTGDSKDAGVRVVDLAKVGGEATQVFEVGTATLATHAVRKEVVDTKAPLASPALTGTPTAPTAAVGTNTTQLATTAFVSAEIANDIYSKTQLDAGQLDNRYYTETEIDSAVVKITTDQVIAGTKTFSSTITGSINGNATTATRLNTTRDNYKDTTDSVVVGQLMWKNFGNGHTIFDASNSTTPTGTATNNINPDIPWGLSHPTLMGYNGENTYGVRVDSSRIADHALAVTNGVYTTENQTIAGVKTFSSSPIVPTPTTGTQAVNKDYADTKVSKPELISVTGSATFDGLTQKITMTNIGNITLAIGDVIEVSGTTSNNKLFTIESVADNNNIIVNYEHRGTSIPITKGRLINETTANCTIKLYNRAKNAPVGQGQYWINLYGSNRVPDSVTYTNTTKRSLQISATSQTVPGQSFVVLRRNGVEEVSSEIFNGNTAANIFFQLEPEDEYLIRFRGTIRYWLERR